MGCIYTGYKAEATVNGIFKVGKTKEKKPTQRLTANKLKKLFYVYVPTASSKQLSLLEGVARCEAERFPSLKGKGKTLDWFCYHIATPQDCTQVWLYAAQVAKAVAEECERRGLEYKIFPQNP